MVWLLPRTRLLEPLLPGGVLLTDRGQVRGNRKHTRARARTRLASGKLKRSHDGLTLNAERSISSRLRAGESLAMMEDAGKTLPAAALS